MQKKKKERKKKKMTNLGLLPVVQELSLNHKEVLFMWDLRRISEGALRTASQCVVYLFICSHKAAQVTQLLAR